jgi:hypothetical protein
MASSKVQEQWQPLRINCSDQIAVEIALEAMPVEKDIRTEEV